MAGQDSKKYFVISPKYTENALPRVYNGVSPYLLIAICFISLEFSIASSGFLHNKSVIMQVLRFFIADVGALANVRLSPVVQETLGT